MVQGAQDINDLSTKKILSFEYYIIFIRDAMNPASAEFLASRLEFESWLPESESRHTF
jgi:hypothetical protein